MNTQTEKILTALKNHKDGLHPTYIIGTLHCYQYNARIYEIRASFGCECKSGYRCSAQEHVINQRLADGTTIFKYEKTGAEIDWEKMRIDSINYKELEVQDNQLSLI